MIRFGETLWSLVRTKPASASRARAASRGSGSRRGGPAAENYERVTRVMLDRYGVTVRRWRRSMSGVALLARGRDGRVVRLIESPRPKGPMSAAVFLHEIGHHAIGVGSVRPRCLEELRAWEFAVGMMEAEGIAVTDRVRERMDSSLRYAVAKAVRRGMKKVPAELVVYAPR